MNFSQDWRFYSVLCILSWGIWGFISKAAADRLEWGVISIIFGFFIVLTASLIAPQSYSALFNKFIWLAVLAGIAEAFGFLFFYRALRFGSANVVIPFTALYVVVSIILSIAFLNEPITLKKIFGILSGITAIILLSL